MARQQRISQWCHQHWDAIRITMDGPLPVNGILATKMLLETWLRRTYEQMGDAFPPANQPEAVQALIDAASPLCCRLGDQVLDDIKSKCILPERYRRMHPRLGHSLHMQEVTGAIVHEGPGRRSGHTFGVDPS